MSTPLELVKKLRPQGTRFEVLAQGHMNDMVVVDRQEVFRFPVNAESRQRLSYEVFVLKALDNQLSVAVPRLLYHDRQGGYSVLSYIPGQVLTSTEIRQFTAAQRHTLAAQLAETMRELNQRLDRAAMERQYQTLLVGLGTWDEYYAQLLRNPVARRSRYFAAYQRYYDLVQAGRAAHDVPPRIVIHGDLHAGNLLFHADNTLAGLVDFGDCEVGTIYHQLRPLMSLGESLVREVIRRLDGELGEVDVALLKNWTIMHELSVLIREPHEGPRQGVARQFLTAMLGRSWDGDTGFQAIIFDCFGVLARERWLDFRDEQFGNDPAALHEINAMMRAVSLGTLSIEDFVAVLSDKTGIATDELDQLLHDNPANDRLFDYVAQLHGRYRIGMLSNVGQNRLHQMFRPEQLTLFDDFALSSEIGYAKPDQRAYEVAAARLDVTPQACVFVDDRERFCEAARLAGMHAIRYESYTQCRAALANAGIA